MKNSIDTLDAMVQMLIVRMDETIKRADDATNAWKDAKNAYEDLKLRVSHVEQKLTEPKVKETWTGEYPHLPPL